MPHDDQIKEYLEQYSTVSVSGNVIMIAAAVISLIMIYFMIKSNAMLRSEELTVYRMFGISNKSIISAFILEIYAMASVTTLPAVLVTAGIIKLISFAPSLMSVLSSRGGSCGTAFVQLSGICHYLHTAGKTILAKHLLHST